MYVHKVLVNSLEGLASVTQLDVCLPGDQEIGGSTPDGLETFYHGDISLNNFYGHSLPSADSKGQLSISDERMCTILVNRLED